MQTAVLTLWLFRVISTVQALVVSTQPVWIGMFLEGGFDYLRVHRIVGGIAIALTLALGVAAIGLWWPGRVARWPLGATVLMFFALGLQFGTGMSRSTAVHVTMGVVIVALSAGLAVWSWRPRRASKGAEQ